VEESAGDLRAAVAQPFTSTLNPPLLESGGQLMKGRRVVVTVARWRGRRTLMLSAPGGETQFVAIVPETVTREHRDVALPRKLESVLPEGMEKSRCVRRCPNECSDRRRRPRKECESRGAGDIGSVGARDGDWYRGCARARGVGRPQMVEGGERGWSGDGHGDRPGPRSW